MVMVISDACRCTTVCSSTLPQGGYQDCVCGLACRQLPSPWAWELPKASGRTFCSVFTQVVGSAVCFRGSRGLESGWCCILALIVTFIPACPHVGMIHLSCRPGFLCTARIDGSFRQSVAGGVVCVHMLVTCALAQCGPLVVSSS